MSRKTPLARPQTPQNTVVRPLPRPIDYVASLLAILGVALSVWAFWILVSP